MSELEDKRKELKELQDFHRSAWEAYGSELCSFEMQAKEEKLRKEILILEGKYHEVTVEEIKSKLIGRKIVSIQASDWDAKRNWLKDNGNVIFALDNGALISSMGEPVYVVLEKERE